MSEAYVCVSVSDGMVYHLAIQLEARLAGPPPAGSGWAGPFMDGTYGREATDAVIQHEVDRAAVAWATRSEGAVTVLGWRRLSQAEHDTFSRNRPHRDALEDVAGVLQHNMSKARELHRHLLRHQRAEKLLILDGAYNGAVGAGNTVRAAAIEAMRAELRDLTSDPRIEAARDVAELVQVGFTTDGEAALDAVRAALRRL